MPQNEWMVYVQKGCELIKARHSEQQLEEVERSGRSRMESISSFSSGSVGEYKFLAAENRRKLEAKEQAKRDAEAQRLRDKIAQETARQTGLLQSIDNAMQDAQEFVGL